MNLQDERLIAVVNERYFEEGKQSGRNEEGREYFWTRGRENRRTKVRPPGSKLDITSINSDEFLDLYPHHFQKRDSDLGDLLIGFFKFYTEEFNFEKDVITISKSGVERELRYSISPTQLPERHKETGPTEKVELLEELEGMNLSDLMGMEEMPSDRRLREEALVAGPQGQPINWEQFPIIIQDPFVIDRNTALMVTDRVFGRFIDVSQCSKLVENHTDQNYRK